MSSVIPRATLYVSTIFGNVGLLDTGRQFSSGNRLKDMMGYQRIEATQIQHGIIMLAGGEQVVRVQFIPRGKRVPCEIVEDSAPTLVILDGWGHPEIREWYNETVDRRTGVTTRAARHLFGAEEWQTEFDEFLDRYLSDSSSLVLADYRSHNTKARAHPDSFKKDDTTSNVQRTVEREGDTGEVLLADEAPAAERFVEGTTNQLLVNAYERNPKARQTCIAFHGTSCMVCGFNFGNTYGEIGKDFVHVHHLTSISEIGDEYEIDPIRDLRPVCANCHAMIHRRTPPYTLDEMKRFLKSRGQ